ncbi:g11696 [Coccomyxa viridis]|uniref:G11696 protein n=1 Tax=Coccomyxa viridis TaxID=1274662 RepID=A0ABP1GB73_9CHLO
MIDGPVILGSKTVRALGSGFWFGEQTGLEGPWVSPIYTSMFLLYLAVVLSKSGKGSPLKYMVLYYTVITSIVEIARVIWDVSRFALVIAALHNLAEWGVIGFACFAETAAITNWWWSQVWILLVAQWIMFAPTITLTGIGEEITGLACDILLIIVWSRLWILSDARKRKYVFWGWLGALLHMSEILPLAALLIGVVHTPNIPACLLIAITTPITFWSYGKMVQLWQSSGDPDLVSPSQGSKSAAATVPTYLLMIIGAMILSAILLLGPTALIPKCPISDMTVAPNGALPLNPAPGFGAVTIDKLYGSGSGLNSSAGNTTMLGGALSGASQKPPPAPSNELLCESSVMLTGFTKVVAKPGMGKELLSMAATMPGVIRQEDGCIAYDVSYGADESVNFHETWSSIRTMLRSIYVYPTVARVFFSERFRNLSQNHTVEGPFMTMLPCSQAQAEAKPVSASYSVVVNAPIDCLWSALDSPEAALYPGVQNITTISTWLRVLNFADYSMSVLRQMPPLPAVPQPANGHSLAFYIVAGGVVDTLCEMYKGTYILTPSEQGPMKTVLTYDVEIVAKSASQTTELNSLVTSTILNEKLPHLQTLGEAKCAHALPASDLHSRISKA